MRHAYSYKLTLRKRTTTAQYLPNDAAKKIVRFIYEARKAIKDHNIPLSAQIAADETAVWVNECGVDTIAPVASQTVRVSTTGNEKVRLTVMLAAAADGTKFPPLVLIPRVRKIVELERMKKDLNIVYVGSNGGWMNSELCVQWIQSLPVTLQFFTRFLGFFQKKLFYKGRRLLLWDSYRAHTAPNVQAELVKQKIDAVIVPGGTTGLIQAPDVSWNRPFKNKVRAQRQLWTEKHDAEKVPTFVDACTWIVNAWKR